MGAHGLCYSGDLEEFSDAVLRGQRGFEAYANNYFGAHTGALQGNFPCTARQLGKDTFAALARVYVMHYPPKHWGLNLYGASFAALPHQNYHQGDKQGGRAHAHDWQCAAFTARIEYAITRAYYAEEAPAATAIRVPPAVTGHQFKFDIEFDLRRQHPVADIARDLLSRGVFFVYRRGLQVTLGTEPEAFPGEG